MELIFQLLVVKIFNILKLELNMVCRVDLADYCYGKEVFYLTTHSTHLVTVIW